MWGGRPRPSDRAQLGSDQSTKRVPHPTRCSLGGDSCLWWFILFLIPLVNIVIAVIVWMGIAEARHQPNWWGILTIVPIANLIVPGYLAWAD
jgi:hypothetical protein